MVSNTKSVIYSYTTRHLASHVEFMEIEEEHHKTRRNGLLLCNSDMADLEGKKRQNFQMGSKFAMENSEENSQPIGKLDQSSYQRTKTKHSETYLDA